MPGCGIKTPLTMSKYLVLSVCVFLAGCKISSGLRFDDISALNGKWSLPCTSSFEEPDELECPEVEDLESIVVDEATGKGKVRSGAGFSKAEMTIEVFEENKKLFIHYFLPGGEQTKGEIVKLNKEELVIKFQEQRYFLTQQRKN